MGEIKKMCNRCNLSKALSSFYPNHWNKDGFNKTCNKCTEKRKDYRAKNKEMIAGRTKDYRAKNKEMIAERRHRFYEKNKENEYESRENYRMQVRLDSYQSGIDFALSQLSGIVDQKILD